MPVLRYNNERSTNTAIAYFHLRLKLDIPYSWVKHTKVQALQASRADAQHAKRSRLSRLTEVAEEEVAATDGEGEESLVRRGASFVSRPPFLSHANSVFIRAACCAR